MAPWWWTLLGGSADFEPSLFAANVFSFFGLLLIAYKTAKALKSRVDIVVAVVNTEYSLEVRGVPATVPPEESLRTHHCKRSLSTGSAGSSSNGAPAADGPPEVEQKLQDVELRAEELLQFWVVFGLVQSGAQYGLAYAVQLRALLVLLAAAPRIFGAQWVHFAFERVAPTVFGKYVPAFIRWGRRKLRLVGSTASPVLRGLLGIALASPVIRGAHTTDLQALEGTLTDSLKVVNAERKRRRRLQALSLTPTEGEGLAAYRLDPEDEEADVLGEFGDFTDSPLTPSTRSAGGGAPGSR